MRNIEKALHYLRTALEVESCINTKPAGCGCCKRWMRFVQDMIILLQQPDPDLSTEVDLSAGAEPGEFEEWWKSYGTYDDANLDYHIAADAWNARQTEIDRLRRGKNAIRELAIGKMQAALDYPEAAVDILHIGITELKKEGKPTPKEILRHGGLLNKLIAENEKLKNGCHELLLKQDELTCEKEAQAEQIEKLESLLSLYRQKRRVDGLNGRMWDGPKHWDIEQQIRKAEGECAACGEQA